VVAGIDIRRLPIGPEEAFVMSRVDGTSGDLDIALGTGLTEQRVRAAIERLRSLGAVRFTDEPDPVSTSGPRESDAPTTMPSPKGQNSTPPTVRGDNVRADDGRADNGRADPEARRAFDDTTREAIEAMLPKLAETNFYELLDVPRSATKKDVKAAYFALIGRFHPDRYYGTNLGESKSKLERIFARLTEAYDTLTRSQLRTAYDATLPPADSPLGRAAPAVGAEVKPAGQAKQIEPSKPPGTGVTGEPAPPESPRPSSTRPHSVPTGSGSRSVDSSDRAGPLPSAPGARRRALARKLQGSLPPGSERVSQTLQAVTAFRPSAIRKADTIPAPPEKPDGHQRFLIAADRALTENNPVAATNALRLALAAKPDDAVIRRRLEETQLAADVRLQDRLKLDAANARGAGRHSEAAQLYGRAARATSDAELYLHAAECSQLAKENPKIAADFAKRGLSLSPDHARLRVVLGRIYADAGMTSSAITELTKARQLLPSDDTIRALLEQIKKT
jgi:curved DNA-binding protein CbpA